jgi:hypothetical protein
VDVPLDEPRYDARFSGPDPGKGCVVDKLMEFVNILGDLQSLVPFVANGLPKSPSLSINAKSVAS